MHSCDLTALSVGLMLFLSILFQRVRAAPPVFLRLARHAGDHEARPSRVTVECSAVGIDEARDPRATSSIRPTMRRFSAPEAAGIQVGPSGSVGIGTTAPSDKLDVNGAIGLTTTTSTLPVNGMYSPSANALSLTASGIQALTVSTTGYVGIGTANPAYPLNIISTYPAQLALQNTSSSSYDALLFGGDQRTYTMGVGNSAESAHGVSNAWFLYDNTVSSMRLVVAQSGYVGVSLYGPERRGVQPGATPCGGGAFPRRGEGGRMVVRILETRAGARCMPSMLVTVSGSTPAMRQRSAGVFTFAVTE